MSTLQKLFWDLAAKGFDTVYGQLDTLNSYTYEPLSLTNPKRTRINKLPVAEPLYGLHLKTEELFEQHIGDMEDPVIAACNGFNDQVLHAFVVFRNGRRNGEYNTLHIRQGSYYPEFMTREETERYFREQNKRVLGAISLARLAEIYGETLSLAQMRSAFKERFQQKDIPYKIKNQNCLTFSLLTFTATNFDLQGFLARVKLTSIQSPYHLIQALAQSKKNHPALFNREFQDNRQILPGWLTSTRKAPSQLVRK